MDEYTTAGAVIRNYRQQAKNAGFNYDSYTDEEILRFLGDDLRNQGRTHEQIQESYGEDFSNQYRDQLNAPERGREGFFGGLKEVGAGFGRGVDGLMSSATALGGMAADFYGLDGVSDKLMEKSAQYRAEAAQGGPSIERATDVRWDNIGEVSRFLAGGLGEAAPSILEAGASFALGGGGGYLIAKQAAKKRLQEVIKNTNRDNLDEVFKSAINAAQAGQKGKAIGSNIALSASSFGMNTGEIYSELYSYSQLDERDPNYISEDKARGLAVSHGLLAGGLDYASAGAMLNRVLGIGDEVATSYLKRVVQGLPAGVFVEGATEAAQQFISMSAEKYAHGNEEPFTDDEINQMIDAGVLGALGGAQFTAIGSIKGPKRDTTEVGAVDDERLAGDPEKDTKGVDDRLATLEQRLAVQDSDLQVGMEVEQFLGVSGKVTEIRADGMVEVLPEGMDEPLVIRADTLSEKIETIDFEKILEDVEEGVKQGDPSSLIQEELANERIEEQKQKEEPAPTPSPQKTSDPDESGIASLDDKRVTGISKTLAKDIEEVYYALKEASENGKGDFRRANSMKQATLVAAGISDEVIRKWRNPKVRGKLIQAGIMKDARGTWLPETKVDKDVAETRRIQKANDREDIILNQLELFVGDTVEVRGRKGQAEVFGFTEDNKVLFEEGGVGIEPSKLKKPRKPKKKVPPAPVEIGPTEEDYQLARDEVVTERQTVDQETTTPEEQMDADIETEKLIEQRAREILAERQREQKLKNQEQIDAEKSNNQIIEETNASADPVEKPKILPEGQIPSKFVGEFDITDGISDSLSSEGDLIGNWEGLSDREKTSKKTTGRGKKKQETKTLGNRVLVVVEKINNKHDDVESGQIRVMSAKQGEMDKRKVLKIYDSLRVGAKGKSPGWRTLYGKGKKGNIDSTPLEGYRLIGKITTQRDAVEYDAGKIDALFDSLEELKGHSAFQTSMKMSSSRKWFGLFKDAENAERFLSEEGAEIIANYKQSLGDRLGSEYLTPEGLAIDPSGQSAPTYISSKEILEYLVRQVKDPTAVDAYVQAYQAFATAGMAEVADFTNKKEAVFDKTFEHDGKTYRIQDILNRARGVEGYEPFADWGDDKDISSPFDLPIVKAALQEARKIEVPTTISGGGTFFDAGKTAGQVAQDLRDESDENLLQESDVRSGMSEFDEQEGRDTGVSAPQLEVTDEKMDAIGSQFHNLFRTPADLSIAIASVRNSIRDEIIALASIDLNATQDAAERLGLDSNASAGAVRGAYDNTVEFVLEEMYKELLGKELITPYYTMTKGGTAKKSKGEVEADSVESDLSGDTKAKQTGGRQRVEERELSSDRLNKESYKMRENLLKNIKKLEQTLTATTKPVTKQPVPVVRAKIRKRLEVDNINRARDSSIGVTAYLHREFGLDLQDSLYHGGFSAEETARIIDELDSMKAFSEPMNNGRNYPIEDKVYKDKTNGARVKSDGTPFESGYLETAHSKHLHNYIDETFNRIEEAVISKDDAEKWSQSVQFLKDAWIPVSYQMEIDTNEVEEAPVQFDEDTKEAQRQKLIEDLNKVNRRVKRIRDGLERLRKTGKRSEQKEEYSAKPRVSRDGTARPSKRDVEIEKDLKLLKKAEDEKAVVAERLNKIIEVPKVAPKQKEFDTVVEDGMLLSEFAQTMSEFFGFSDGMPFLNDEFYNALHDHTSVEVITQDVVSTIDKRIRHRSFVSPTTGKSEPSMPLVIDEESAKLSDRLARQKTSIAVRSSSNPLEKMGMQKQLADNRLAIAEFLDGGQTDQPFSLASAVDRIIDIVESNPNFREAEALAFLARKLKGNRLTNGVQVRFVPWDKYSKVASVNEYGYSAAQYMPKQKEIWVSDVFGDGTGSSMENLISSLVHEGIHVPTKQFLDVGYAYFTNNPLAKELLEDSSMGEEFGKIYGHIHETLLPMLRKQGGADMIYGLSSADEFFSEVGSDYQLRNFLRGIKLSNEDRKQLGIQGKSAIRTAWDYVVNLLVKLLGVSDRVKQDPELLKYTEDMLNKVVDMADDLAYMGRGINDVNVRGISSLDIFAGPKRVMGDSVMEEAAEFKWIDGTTRKHIVDSEGIVSFPVSENDEENRFFEAGAPMGEQLKSSYALRLHARNGKDVMLNELINHPELFKAYPQLAKVSVIFSNDLTRANAFWRGTWDKSKNDWGGSPQIVIGPRGQTASTLVHEIQHAVDEIEGFPRGTNQEVGQKIFAEIIDSLTFTDGVAGDTRITNGMLKKFEVVLTSIQKDIYPTGSAGDTRKLAKARYIYDGWKDDYDKFQLFNFLETIKTVIGQQALPEGGVKLSDFLANASYSVSDGSYSMADLMYFWNFGEITARMQQALLKKDPGGRVTQGVPLTDKDEEYGLALNTVLPEGQKFTPEQRENAYELNDKLFDKSKPGTGWTIPSESFLANLVRGYKNKPGDFFVPKVHLLNTLNAAGRQYNGAYSASNELPAPANNKSIPRPDDSARVYHEATAGGMNELIAGLGQAFKAVRKYLPANMNIEQFIDSYGKLSLGFGSKNVSTAFKSVGKNLQPFGINPTEVRITDAGRNRTAKHYGLRYAIAYIEKTREQARKNVSSLVTNLENSRVEVAAKKSLLKSLETGQLESLDNLANAVRDKIINRADASVEQLEKIISSLPKDVITQEDLKKINKVTTKEVGDAMVALLEQPGVIEERSANEINSLVETGLIPGLGAFQGSDKQTSLRRAVFVNAVKNSPDIMSLLRLSRNKLGMEQREFIQAGKEVLSATSKSEVESVANNFSKRLGTKLKHIKEAKIRILELENSFKGVESDIAINKAIDETLKFRSDKFRWTLGELEDFDIHDGSKIRVMVKNAKGEYDKNSFQILEVKFKNGEIEDRKGFIKANRETLEWIRNNGEKYANEPWLDIMREQAELALQLPVTQQWSAVRRSSWMAGLESLNQRFSRLGYEGKRLAQMTSRTVALYRDLISQSMKYSKEFNRAYDNVLKATGETGTSFYTGMYQDIFYWFDNHPEFAGNEDLAFSEMWKEMRKTANVKDRTKLNDNARRAVKVLVEKTIQARDWEAKVNRDLGNRVKDSEVKVQSYIDGDTKNVDFYRMPLDMGYATLPRAINDAKVNSLMEYMQEKGWSGTMNAMPTNDIIFSLHRNGEVEELGSEIEMLFDEQIVNRFLNPFMNGMNRKSLFYGPADSDGWGQEMSNAYISEVWRNSGGSILKFMDTIYESSANGEFEEPQKRGDWYLSMYKQIHKRFREVNNVYQDMLERADAETRHSEALKHVPRSLDARQVESRLPKDFFLYDMYDEVSTPIRMAMFSAASVFGRDGSKATEAFRGGRGELKKSYDKFSTIIAEVTGARPDKPSGSYSRAVKKAAYDKLKEMGSKKPRDEFQKLYNDAVAYGELLTTFRHLKDYYGANNDAGPFKDARFLLELLGTQSLTVLNNPKSSFWQGMSMFEFPLAFRGANKMAARGTAKALANFVNQTFGGVAEAMGVQLDRVGRYASSLNSTHYRMEEMELGLRDYLTQIGMGGEMQDPANMKRYLRMIKGVATHHKKRGTRAPVDLMTAVTGLFPYINNVVNHSVGVGAAYVYQDLVLKVAKHIKDNGLRQFQEITAEDLGLGQGSFEWIVGEKDGFNNANNMLIDSGAPSISRMAFDYVDRLQSNPKAPVMSHEQILMVNQMAMNNMSGEGFNSKPAWLYTNPMMKYFAFFLGWPLGKMARDNKFIFRGDGDSVNSYAAFLKYIGLMSAIYLPVGLSFAFLVDWYDEEVLGKPNSLPPLTPWAMLPVVGPAIAATDEQFTMYSLTSRMAKAGTPYGMGFDVMNSIMAKGDTYGGTKEFSLDSRIFAFSIFKNFYDSMGNWMHQGEFDWGNVGRPLAYAFGGNSVLQGFDATNNLFQFDNFESRVADYIGVRNYVKKTAYLMGMPMRPPSPGYGRPTPVSVNIKQMERAAYAGDEKDFDKQYAEAIEAAREYLVDNPRVNMTPEKYVLQRFKDRSLRAGITRSKIGDEDWGALLDNLPSDARAKIKKYESNHEYFLKNMEGGATDFYKPMDFLEMRRRLTLGY